MRILLADNDTRVCSALSMLLGCDPALQIVGQSDNTADLLELAPRLAPDLVLLDWELPGQVDGALIADLRRLLPAVKILVLSGRPESEGPALRAGADGFVSKADPAEHLLADIVALLDYTPAGTPACPHDS
ncbi:MAG: response regulator transcription factor [Anaerolineae bacterium]|nr:response regulator transcription factor [Anaerolineae bacterium]